MQPKPRYARAATAVLAVTLALTLAQPACAQVPEHHAVIGTTYVPPNAVGSGTTGVFFVPLPTDPSQPAQTPIPVTGLPPELTLPVGSQFGGAFAVLHRPSDGTLFVGDGAAGSGVVHVHVLKLAGAAVQRGSVAVPVGTVRSGWRLDVGGLALLPNGDVLVAMGKPVGYVPGSGPGADSTHGILTTAGGTPVLTAIKLQGTMAGFPDAGLVISPDGTTAYVTTQNNAGQPPHLLYEVDLRPGPMYGQISLLHTWGSSEFAFHPTIDRDGTMYVSVMDSALLVSTLYRIDTNVRPILPRQIGSPFANLALTSPELDPATGRLVMVSYDAPGTRGGQWANAVVTVDKQGQNLRVIAMEPGAGWAAPLHATDINPSIEHYGEASDGANRYRFVDCPNPGGVPKCGNQTFSLTVESVPGNVPPILSVVVVGIAKANIPWWGLTLLVAPGPATVTFPITLAPAPNNRASVNLPIPARPMCPVRLSLYAQSLHFESQILTQPFTASAAVEFTIFF